MREIEADIKQARELFDKARSTDNKTLPAAKAEDIRKLLHKVHHELIKAYEIPDYTKTKHMREFIFDYERAYQHRGTPDGTEHLRKAIDASGQVLKDMIAEKERREKVDKAIKKRKEKNI